LKNSLFYCDLEFTYQIDLFYTEMAEQERRLRDMTDEMESYKKQQEELEEQRRAAEELRLQYEESAHMAQEEKDRLVCILTNDGIFVYVETIIHVHEMISSTNDCEDIC
jgi:flagellar motility protein MotE (MotC chaperone)